MCIDFGIMCLVIITTGGNGPKGCSQNPSGLSVVKSPVIGIESCGSGFLISIPDEEGYFKGINFFGNINKPLHKDQYGNTSIVGNFVLRPGKIWRFFARDIYLKDGDIIYYGITIKTNIGWERTERNFSFTVTCEQPEKRYTWTEPTR